MRFARRLGTLARWGAALFAVLTPQRAFSYDHPLGDEAVRDAYFVGQDKTGVNAFLAPYTQELPLPDSGPHVAEVELSTPYTQVVEDSAQHASSYSAQEAADAYRKRGDVLLVRVKVLFTPTYSGDDDYWRGVSVGLIQKGKHMGGIGVTGQPIYTADPEGGELPIGANIYVTFSVNGVQDGPLQVEIEPPGGAQVHAKFDLSSLR